MVVLAVVNFLFYNQREKRSEPLTEQSSTASFRNSYSTPVQNCYIITWPGFHIGEWSAAW